MAGPVLDTTADPPLVWLLSEDKALYALSETGNLIGRMEMSGENEAFLAIDAAGRALVATKRALSAFTRGGIEAFRAPLPEGRLRGPAIGPDSRLFLCAGSTLFCLSRAGNRLWSVQLPAEPSAGPALDEVGFPRVGFASGTLLLFDPYGSLLSRFEAGSPILALASGSGVAGLGDGRLLALKRRDGESEGGAYSVAWEAKLGASPRSLAVMADGGVICLDSAGTASGYSKKGERLFSFAAGIRDGLLHAFTERVVATSKGKALSFDLQGGVYREATIKNAAAAGLPSPSGLLFSAGEDWVLAAYRFETRLGRPATPRPEPYKRPRDSVAEALVYDSQLRDSSHRLAIIADIEKSLESGRIGADELRAVSLASAFALGELENVYPQTERRFRGDPFVRARSSTLLGAIGSTADIPILLEVFSFDPDVSVRAAACDALGAIAADPDGTVGAAYYSAVAGTASLDEQVALALVSSMERAALISGTAPTTEAVRALLRLSGSSYGSAVRDRATRALGRIAGVIGPRNKE